MPLHRFYHTQGLFTGEQKKAISERITAVYASVGLPEFYVCVVFIEVPADSMYIGGRTFQNYVRIVSQHLARTMSGAEEKAGVIAALEAAWAPDVKDKGVHWESHIEEHERELWRCDGIVPPMPGTEAEKLWVKENRAVPY